MSSLIASFLFCTLLSFVFLLGRTRISSSRSDSPRACRRVGIERPQKLSHWHQIKHALSRKGRRRILGKSSTVAGVVEGLYVHPIKSCRAVEVAEAEVFSAGLKYDRRYTFAELRRGPDGTDSGSSGWEFVTQRKYGKLANIRLEIWEPDPDSLDYALGEPNVQSGGVLVVRYPAPGDGVDEQRSFEIPFDPTKGQIRNQGYVLQKMRIWKDTPDSLLITSTDRSDAPPWIKDIQAYIGSSKHLALFRVASGNDRHVFRNAPRKAELGYQSLVGFADAYPLNLLGLASVADLDRRLKETAPGLTGSTALRFRANIYFKGSTAYAEDSWKRIRIGQHISARNCDAFYKGRLADPPAVTRHKQECREARGPYQRHHHYCALDAGPSCVPCSIYTAKLAKLPSGLLTDCRSAAITALIIFNSSRLALSRLLLEWVMSWYYEGFSNHLNITIGHLQLCARSQVGLDDSTAFEFTAITASRIRARSDLG
ncbi:MAG: hypothetical protein LQ348_006096 [Seirophora lacunosa]|nr:MAG: hypothetical protein LQ348_006096 [Seirophora lacunosa]